MPELTFKGKEFVYNHHLSVPFRPLIPDPEKSVVSVGETPRLDRNLIIHGDNLHALKALLPMHAGRVDCIYIDPPYNTGNEGWCYNDNVNSPMMREWLDSNPVGLEDGLRHEKWCAMMYPRLRLLHELLADDGSIFVSIDDNEVQSLRFIMDELFGDKNHLATFIWRKVDSPNDNKVAVTPDHEYVIAYAKNKEQVSLSRLIAPAILDAYPNTDENDGRKYRDRLLKKNGRNSLRSDRPTMFFPIEDPDGGEVYPIHDNGEEACWAAGGETVARHRAEGTLIWKRKQKLGREVWEPYTREFAPSEPARPYPTIWSDLPTMRQAKAMLRDIFATADLFDTPKPVELVQRILDLVGKKDALVLDSFAGSGTTGHAVLLSNQRDGGDRQFILVEGEDYADRLTAERNRRASAGYKFVGTRREELYREKLNFRDLSSAHQLLQDVQGIENLQAHRFERVRKDLKDGVLTLVGEEKVTGHAAGLGGNFTFCTLGEPIDVSTMLAGENLPSFEQLGAWLFHTATGEAFSPAQIDPDRFYLGASSAYHVWLIYRPDLAFLKSREAALTLAWATQVAEARPVSTTGKRHLVFAPAKFAPNKHLLPLGVEHAPLPFALFKIER